MLNRLSFHKHICRLDDRLWKEVKTELNFSDCKATDLEQLLLTWDLLAHPPIDIMDKLTLQIWDLRSCGETKYKTVRHQRKHDLEMV